MELTANIGPLAFRLREVATCRVGELNLRPLTRSDGVDVFVLDFDEGSALLIDHRADSTAVARVEAWEPLSACEGDVRGLLVLSDTALRSPCRSEFPSMHDLFPFIAANSQHSA